MRSESYLGTSIFLIRYSIFKGLRKERKFCNFILEIGDWRLLILDFRFFQYKSTGLSGKKSLISDLRSVESQTLTKWRQL